MASESSITTTDTAGISCSESPVEKVFKLRIRCPPFNPVIEVNASASYADLLKAVAEATQLPYLKEQEKFSLLVGFPPKRLVASPGDPISSLLSNGEVLTPERNRGAESASHQGHPQENPNSPSTPRGKKRGEGASERVISSLTSGPRGPGNIRTLSSPSSSTSRASSTTPGSSRRKCSGARGGGGHHTHSLGSTEEEVAENLVRLFTDKGNSAAEKGLRKAFSLALQQRYDETAADERWGAVQGRRFQIKEGHPQPGKFTVEYVAPVAGRADTKRSEEYTALPRGLVILVLSQVWQSAEDIDRHNLRPYYMAHAQPMMFWNIARHFDGDFASCFRQIIPAGEVDKLLERSRELSEKAKENKRQAEEAAQLRATRKLLREQRLAKHQAGQKPAKPRSTSRGGGAEDFQQQGENVRAKEEQEHSRHTSSVPLQSGSESVIQVECHGRIDALVETSVVAEERVKQVQRQGDAVGVPADMETPVAGDDSEKKVSGGAAQSCVDGRAKPREETGEETCKTIGTVTDSPIGDGASSATESPSAVQLDANEESAGGNKLAGEGGEEEKKTEDGKTQQDSAEVVAPHSPKYPEMTQASSSRPEHVTAIEGTGSQEGGLADSSLGAKNKEGKATGRLEGEPGSSMLPEMTLLPDRRQPVLNYQVGIGQTALAAAVPRRNHSRTGASSQLVSQSDRGDQGTAGRRARRKAPTPVVPGVVSEGWEEEGDDDYNPSSQDEEAGEEILTPAKPRKPRKKRRVDSKPAASVN
ncbi:hypothetical protein CSUI_002395 [Cystoisospora suis]|uniref:ubiquitinyl hydrolase 1 n=1 Tax=Cystoisospora suis TaxID=483139 RepID=A0A2C6L878_9APIC|nr:hypothetical protein CSUI_002395 [Cystoisospora suis]